MSIIRGCNLDDANVSEKCVGNAVLVHVKIQQAQDLIKQINVKLSFTVGNLEKKQIACDGYQRRLSNLRWGEQYIQRYSMYGCGFGTIHHTFAERTYKNDVRTQTTIREQDDLIRNLRYKLLDNSKCLAEEKKLIKQISDAEEVRETIVEDPKAEIRRTYYAKNINDAQVCRAILQKKKHERKVLEALEQKRLKTMQEIRLRVNEKKSKVHKVIYDLVKEQVQEPHETDN